jgi:hypothetical protein
LPCASRRAMQTANVVMTKRIEGVPKFVGACVDARDSGPFAAYLPDCQHSRMHPNGGFSREYKSVFRSSYRKTAISSSGMYAAFRTVPLNAL